MTQRSPEWEAKRRAGVIAAWARKKCSHPEMEKVQFLSGGAGTYFLRCRTCGKYEATVGQYRRHGRRGKKVREGV